MRPSVNQPLLPANSNIYRPNFLLRVVPNRILGLQFLIEWNLWDQDSALYLGIAGTTTVGGKIDLSPMFLTADVSFDSRRVDWIVPAAMVRMVIPMRMRRRSCLSSTVRCTGGTRCQRSFQQPRRIPRIHVLTSCIP